MFASTFLNLVTTYGHDEVFASAISDLCSIKL